MNILIPVGIAAAAAMLLGGSKTASAKSGALPQTGQPGQPKASELPGANAQPSPALVAQIDAVVKSADPNAMRQVAATLKALGFEAQAADLVAAAAEVEKAMGARPATTPAPVKPAPFPITSPGQPTGTVPTQQPAPIVFPSIPSPILPTQSPLPGGGVFPVAPPADRGQVLAAKVALMIRNTTRGREDKELVKAFQVQESQKGVPIGAIDGLYGPKTALAIANLGIVPPKPFYWSNVASTAKTQRQSYSESLLKLSLQEPVRAEEWRAAAKV